MPEYPLLCMGMNGSFARGLVEVIPQTNKSIEILPFRREASFIWIKQLFSDKAIFLRRSVKCSL